MRNFLLLMKSLLRVFILISLLFFVNYTLATPVLAGVGFGLYKSSLAPATHITAETGEWQLAESQAIALSAGDFAGALPFSFFDGHFGLEIPAGFIIGHSQMSAKRFTQGQHLPWNLDRLSDIYEVSFAPAAGFDNKKALDITLVYDQPNNDFKQVYYFDQASASWKAVPTTDFPVEKKVKAVLSRTAIRVAVFARPGVLTVGQASWYKYKGGLFAASPDFPKGSKLRVTNLDNGQSVEVEVNDWGPERAKHPDRVIDLDKEAFSAIAETSAGLINVSVSPIKLAADASGRVLGVKAEGLASMPQLSARSAVIINEATGEILFDKNSGKDAPLASLTKLVAVKVFLDTGPDLSQSVAYKLQDEEYNYRYCQPWESVKVRLKEGEGLTIKDLLYSALVGSANNVVETLVRVSGLSRDAFIGKMNEQVVLWGARSTQFIEPTGLSASNVSSAIDYALIMKAVLTNELMAQISSTPSYTFKTAAGVSHTIKNTNKLISDQLQASLQAEKFPISASKTGYLLEAGYCLATRVKARDNNNYIIVTLGASTRENSFSEMSDLIKYLNRTI